MEVLTKNLCCDQVNLLEADAVFRSVMDDLLTQHTAISDELYYALKERYDERKNTTLLSCSTIPVRLRAFLT